MKKQEFITETLVEKAIQDITNLRIEAKKRNLESQLPRWFSNYMQGLQKTDKKAHEIIVEMFENKEV